MSCRQGSFRSRGADLVLRKIPSLAWCSAVIAILKLLVILIKGLEFSFCTELWPWGVARPDSWTLGCRPCGLASDCHLWTPCDPRINTVQSSWMERRLGVSGVALSMQNHAASDQGGSERNEEGISLWAAVRLSPVKGLCSLKSTLAALAPRTLCLIRIFPTWE